METYLVGGAVRDELLGLPVNDRDWVVVGASVEQMLENGYRLVGQDFPVFLHPESGEEYALARTERKSGRGYKGFVVNADPSVTLEEDLQRRDLTINAMARDSAGQLIDPFGGSRDIDSRTLRHVSPAFVEDPLRVLRVARFAARFAERGFTIADETRELMQTIVSSGELAHLAGERIWYEMHTALSDNDPVVFVTTLRDCGALAAVLPEVDRLFGVPQPPQWHPEVDTGIHTLMCLAQASGMSERADVRFATLLHDIGKGLTPPQNWPSHHGHEKLGADAIEKLCDRLRTPNGFRDLARLGSLYHTQCHRIRELRPSTVLKLLSALDAFRRPERVEHFLTVCEADSRGRTGFEQTPYPQADILRTAMAAAQAIQAKHVIAGMPESHRSNGEKIRRQMEQHRLVAIREALESPANTQGATEPRD